MYNLVRSFGAAALLSGCCASTVVPKPGDITLEKAMASVGKGLIAMHEAEKGLKTGLVPSEVSVTFNISAKAGDADKLYVEVGAPTGAPVTGKLGGEASTSLNTERGNQITIKFSNLLLSGDKTFVKDKSPQQIKELTDMLKQIGWDVFYTH